MIEIGLSELVNKQIELEEAIKREEETFLAKVEELCRAFEEETGVCLKRPVFSELFFGAKVEIDFEKSRKKMEVDK